MKQQIEIIFRIGALGRVQIPFAPRDKYKIEQGDCLLVRVIKIVKTSEKAEADL